MSADELQLRLEGGMGAEAQMAAWKHTVTVQVESVLGLKIWMATGGLTISAGNILELEGRIRD